MNAPPVHPNEHLLKRCAPVSRNLRRIGYFVFALCLLSLRVGGEIYSGPLTRTVIVLVAIAATVVFIGGWIITVQQLIGYVRHERPWGKRRRRGLVPFARMWGGKEVLYPPVELEHPLLGPAKDRRYDVVAHLSPTDNGRRVFAFEVHCKRDWLFENPLPRYMSCIAVELDPTWTKDLSNVTVSPSSAAFVLGKRDIRDRRWELLDLDSRFQFDAGVSTGSTDVALAQLFGPQMQIALGSTFCAYWQQRGRWLLVWIPGHHTSFTSWQALWNDALWLRSRYAELGRAPEELPDAARAA